MMTPFESLRAAILSDKRDEAKALLKKYPQLSTYEIPEPWYETGIVHWLYAGDVALHLAAAAYRVEIGRLLLVAGADANAAKNHRDARPLHYASDGHTESACWDPKQQVAMIRVLLEAGADIDAQDKNGATALHRAVRTRCAGAVHCLLEASSDATIQNKSGSTPFHLAVQNTGRGGSGSEQSKTAQREIIQAFLKKGISAALKDGRSRSVDDWAKSDSIRDMLVNVRK